ncbi:hypothetical protein JCM10212_002407 [Sporobolomyces blumeae]
MADPPDPTRAGAHSSEAAPAVSLSIRSTADASLAPSASPPSNAPAGPVAESTTTLNIRNSATARPAGPEAGEKRPRSLFTMSLNPLKNPKSSVGARKASGGQAATESALSVKGTGKVGNAEPAQRVDQGKASTELVEQSSRGVASDGLPRSVEAPRLESDEGKAQAAIDEPAARDPTPPRLEKLATPDPPTAVSESGTPPPPSHRRAAATRSPGKARPRVPSGSHTSSDRNPLPASNVDDDDNRKAIEALLKGELPTSTLPARVPEPVSPPKRDPAPRIVEARTRLSYSGESLPYDGATLARGQRSGASGSGYTRDRRPGEQQPESDREEGEVERGNDYASRFDHRDYGRGEQYGRQWAHSEWQRSVSPRRDERRAWSPPRRDYRDGYAGESRHDDRGKDDHSSRHSHQSEKGKERGKQRDRDEDREKEREWEGDREKRRAEGRRGDDSDRPSKRAKKDASPLREDRDRRAPSRTPMSDDGDGDSRSGSMDEKEKTVLSPRAKRKLEERVKNREWTRRDGNNVGERIKGASAVDRDEGSAHRNGGMAEAGDSRRRNGPLPASPARPPVALPTFAGLPPRPAHPQGGAPPLPLGPGPSLVAHPPGLENGQNLSTHQPVSIPLAHAASNVGPQRRMPPSVFGQAPQADQKGAYERPTPPTATRPLHRLQPEIPPNGLPPRPAYGGGNVQIVAEQVPALPAPPAQYPPPPPAPYHPGNRPTSSGLESRAAKGSNDPAKLQASPAETPKPAEVVEAPFSGIRTQRGNCESWIKTPPAVPSDEASVSVSTPFDETAHRFMGSSHISEYTLQDKLGEGTFGVVYKGVRGKADAKGAFTATAEERQEEERLWARGLRVRKGDVVALKQIIFHNEGDGLPITSVREIRILKQLDHPNVVPVVDMALDPGDSSKFEVGKTFMVFPYMDHDLAGLLENPRVKLEVPEIKLYCKQLLEGTAYLHRNGILHRDMKAANLLINNKGCLMIADFGLARSMERPEVARDYTSCVVTRWYRPPELLLGERKYHYPVDMWGVGCILLEMFKKTPIFPGNSDLHQAQLIFAACGAPTDGTMPGWRDLPGVEGIDKAQQVWTNGGRSIRAEANHCAGELFADLLDQILVLDPQRRLTADEALDHDWFWSDPYPTEPHLMREFMSSHEYDRRKLKESQHNAFGQVPAMQPLVQVRPQPVAMGPPAGPPGMPYPAVGAFNGPPPAAPPYQCGYQGGPPNMQQPPPMQMPMQRGGGGGMMPSFAGGGQGPPGMNGQYGPPNGYAAPRPPVSTLQGQPLHFNPPHPMTYGNNGPGFDQGLNYGQPNRSYNQPSGPSWASQNGQQGQGAPAQKVNLKQRLAQNRK